MVKTTNKKQQEPRKEAIPKGDAFMPTVPHEQLKRAYDKERPGKSQIILGVCVLRKEGMEIRKIARKKGQKYSTVRGWLLRMMNAGLDRRYDEKSGRKKQKMDVGLANAVGAWLDNLPECYGFASGTWQLDMVAVMLHREYGISYHIRKLQRLMKQWGFSYTKARPVPAKSASLEEQLEFMNETNEEVASLIDAGFAIFFEDEAGVEPWRIRLETHRCTRHCKNYIFKTVSQAVWCLGRGWLSHIASTQAELLHIRRVSKVSLEKVQKVRTSA